MFAFSITFKLLVWYLALKHGDVGRPSRPWIFGVAVAFVFAGFDVFSGYRDPRGNIMLCVIYLLAALAVMNAYYRIQNIAWSLLVAVFGTFILFFGIPYGAIWLEF